MYYFQIPGGQTFKNYERKSRIIVRFCWKWKCWEFHVLRVPVLRLSYNEVLENCLKAFLLSISFISIDKLGLSLTDMQPHIDPLYYPLHLFDNYLIVLILVSKIPSVFFLTTVLAWHSSILVWSGVFSSSLSSSKIIIQKGKYNYIIALPLAPPTFSAELLKHRIFCHRQSMQIILKHWFSWMRNNLKQ